ncbi:MAG: malate synthase A [Alphaproteobacteria bacterium]
MTAVKTVAGIVLSGLPGPRYEEILTPQALEFLADLHRSFDGRRRDLLAVRLARQQRFDSGELPDFLVETQQIRRDDWRVAPMPAEVNDRRVEMTGPVDRRSLVEGLNAGARVYMGDFEDGTSPTWSNMIEGQINVFDRWRDQLRFVDPAGGPTIELSESPSVLMTRPRGWHLPESHVEVDGEPMSGSLFDFALTFFHNAHPMLAKGSRPYFYLPKLEGHLEARLWSDVFVHSEGVLGLPAGTIKATVLIETLPAAFEMDEILYELRDHSIGLNCGRWDYIFSLIKTFRTRPSYLLPDRNQLDMGGGFLKAYSELLIKTCHRRGTFAMGGMSAYIPHNGDGPDNAEALMEIRQDKTREADAGHDGTWVAHTALVPTAMTVFDRLMPAPNQLSRQRPDLDISQLDLLEVHDGIRTEQGLRHNIRHGVQYLEAWLRGEATVPLDNSMEDVAITEISRGQIWQQLRFRASLAEGSKVTPALFARFLSEEMDAVEAQIGEEAYRSGRFAEAIALFTELSMAEELEPFMTLAAYKLIS